MLHEKTAIFVGDRANVIFSNHHLGISDSISLGSAWDRGHVFVDIVLKAALLSFVVGHDPLHVLLGEVSHNTVRVQDFRVTVVKLTNHSSISSDQAVCL